MEALSYTDPKLAAFYDALNAGDADFRFYESRIGPAPCDVLDLGCGTGTWALRLAAQGHRVCALDPAEAMVAVARGKDRNEEVQWHVGELSLLPPEAAFDVITMTGHAFQCLLADSDVAHTLRGMYERLRAGGRVMFETRNPALLPWRHWTPQGSLKRAPFDGGGTLEYWNVLLAHIGQLIQFESHYRMLPAGTHWVSESQLRFMHRARLAEHLAAAGFDRVDWYGDWDGSPYESLESREIIAVAYV
ncbi:MAG: class I SAM-dependent methyltransferase [Paludibacterium sp.]|uniref:class I SAM-dependent methyltransferase n=1 Tax=Paludibacterium sp. TaxID=1917523 RepID=UPI0025E976DC|nr:class I SAM-dependent methyltransferase [Paludibacterium sp.]MBV8046093.1 class I SAM-dependent methyltransferase [Paludibacterium sp.]MBV8647426.1 class I SAM-dependent methyltransferase [Paludibacterium sp.]